MNTEPIAQEQTIIQWTAASEQSLDYHGELIGGSPLFLPQATRFFAWRNKGLDPWQISVVMPDTTRASLGVFNHRDLPSTEWIIEKMNVFESGFRCGQQQAQEYNEKVIRAAGEMLRPLWDALRGR